MRKGLSQILAVFALVLISGNFIFYELFPDIRKPVLWVPIAFILFVWILVVLSLSMSLRTESAARKYFSGLLLLGVALDFPLFLYTHWDAKGVDNLSTLLFTTWATLETASLILVAAIPRKQREQFPPPLETAEESPA